MRDEDKTKEELVKELVKLRKQLAEATGRPLKTEDVQTEDIPGSIGSGHDAAPDGEASDPWQPIETKLVLWSVLGGMIALVVLAILVHMFLLGGH